MHCEKHGIQNLLVACEHVIEGEASEYNRSGNTILCPDCDKISFMGLDAKLARVICEACFAELVKKKGLRQINHD